MNSRKDSVLKLPPLPVDPVPTKVETLTKTETPENEVTPASLSVAVPAPSATDIATTRSVPMAADTSASLTKRVTRKRKAPLSPPENTENPSK